MKSLINKTFTILISVLLVCQSGAFAWAEDDITTEDPQPMETMQEQGDEELPEADPQSPEDVQVEEDQEEEDVSEPAASQEENDSEDLEESIPKDKVPEPVQTKGESKDGAVESNPTRGGDEGAVTWSLDDGVLTISGSGAMEDYETASESPWYADRQSITKVVIEDGITHIGNRAFYNLNNLEEVEIGGSVESIGAWAFYKLPALGKLTIPSSVNSLGDSSIRLCSSLREVFFLGDAPSVGTNVFVDCSEALCITNHIGSLGWDVSPWTSYSLRSKHIVKIVNIINEPTCDTKGLCQGICMVCEETMTEEIPALGHNYVDGVCTRCGKKEILDYGSGWILYGNGVLRINEMYDYPYEGAVPWFDNLDRIKIVELGNSISFIGDHAFEDCCNLERIVLNDNIRSIGYQAFFGCSSLTSITIPDGVQSIGDSAFIGCESLKSIKIPDSVTKIERGTFSGCNSLESITIPFIGESREQNRYSFLGYIFGANSHSFTNRNWPDSLKQVVLTDSVTSIGEYAFDRCTSLESIIIPDSVQSIGVGAFQNCVELKSITIPEGVTSIEDSTFMWCRSLESITIPDSVQSIGSWAFACCNSLKSITIPDGVTTIGMQAFSDCFNLTCFTLPTNISSIGDGALPLSAVSVSGIVDKKYTGKAITQNLTVKLGSRMLVPGIDYKISYYNNTDVGKATISITGNGITNGGITRSFIINPKPSSLSSLKAAKKGFTVRWKKCSNINGYQVQYALNSKFTKGSKTTTIKKAATISKKFTKLKAKKKYYVRVRTYKTVNGKKYYSDWSKAKSVTTKK